MTYQRVDHFSSFKTDEFYITVGCIREKEIVLISIHHITNDEMSFMLTLLLSRKAELQSVAIMLLPLL